MFGAAIFATSPLRADVLAGHQVRLDDQGKLLAWSSPQDRAYDNVMRLSWGFLKAWPRIEANGLKTYLAYPTFNQTTLAGGNYPNIPAGNHAMTTDSAVRYFAYSADSDVLRVMREMLDHQLAHGTTPSGWVYGDMPWASSDPGQVDYKGSSFCNSTCGTGDGVGVTEPDKGAELAYAYLQAYETTEDPRYRDGAKKVADTLVKTRRAGDATHSPWPFRVVAETGESKEEYASNYDGVLMLFDELIRLGVGDVASYQTARDAAWTWLLAYPFQSKNWSGGFEDQQFFHDPAHDRTQYIPQKIAQYILERPEVDPEWRTHFGDLIPWVEANFAIDTATEKGVQYGANVISEQQVYMVKMGNHTARYASVNALWYELTGDLASREKAYRSLNWATYVCRPNGLVSFNPTLDEWWFATGYGDYVRNFMTALGAMPELAPLGESHIVRSSSMIQSVLYEPLKVTYRTFHDNSVETVRVAFTPTHVSVNGASLPFAGGTLGDGEGYTTQDLGHGDFAMRIRHVKGRDIVITGVPSPKEAPEDASAPAKDGGAVEAPTATAIRAGGGGCSSTAPWGFGASAGVANAALLLTLLARRRAAHRARGAKSSS